MNASARIDSVHVACFNSDNATSRIELNQCYSRVKQLCALSSSSHTHR